MQPNSFRTRMSGVPTNYGKYEANERAHIRYQIQARNNMNTFPIATDLFGEPNYANEAHSFSSFEMNFTLSPHIRAILFFSAVKHKLD